MSDNELRNKWIRCIKYNVVKYNLFSPFFIIINIFYTYYLTFKFCGLTIKNVFVFTNGIFYIDFEKHKSSTVIIRNNAFIEFGKFSNQRSSRIRLGKNASLRINGCLSIGEDNFIDIRNDASLSIGGREVSGITSSSKIICTKNIIIGSGVLISWGCFISDSSHHSINGIIKVGEVVIGNHVWINNDVMILPFSKINDGSIVMAKSLINKKFHSTNVIIGGTPGVIIKNNIIWE
ncbi:acyltransferase [Aliivibrio fischeri]|uniref:acyltransferase n=1 Tax=Aliivibrio fischeri TaxID=668 RepID=UPI00147E99AD|nr:hypothetical protein [Aliivibrio fischeri]